MSATQSSFSSDRPLLGRARLILKGIHFAGVLLLGVVLLPSVALLGRHAKHLINWWLGRMLAALAVDVELDGQAPAAPMLVVANHCSWLDILVLGWAFNTAFVSKAEVGKWPIVGSFARAGGTLFLSRGAGKTGETSARIREVLDNGRSVLFFPEGTTTCDPSPQRFHARLFAAAIDGGYSVLPVGLRYCDDTTPPGMHHALAPWVNEAPLGPHFKDLFRLRGITAQLRICAPINPRGYDRRSLAEAARTAVAHRQAVATAKALREGSVS
ncbi:lysophospholipid acyltransferase family protein [Salinisphaera japonica]|uniref:Glycerol acyltransferase n=1 Tax=Salinisphaera japonica YTM-1 TaxID=1209778 RepID=A0A423Q1Q4_9GAMM|nr:lysophospholipid acyltransferase family protein [Salinisphaera japonica]ROO32303.1 glycerol acyltransferase [Salinisphaera japonica YTM-1]